MSDTQSTSKLPKLKWIALGAVIFFAGFVGMGVFNAILATTNQTEFCTSCHTMETPLRELQESLHWSNASGVHAGCADCHVPKSFFPKMMAKTKAAKDVWHTLLGTIDTPEKYELHRWEMANTVWEKMRATDSRECRECHSFDHMDLSEQSRAARKKHEKAVDTGKTCIDCHQGVAHELPDEPDEDEEVSK